MVPSIKVGQIWQTREGKFVKVVEEDRAHTIYPYFLSNGMSVTDLGRDWRDGIGENDLVKFIVDSADHSPWNGGECPVAVDKWVVYVQRDGGVSAGWARDLCWDHHMLTALQSNSDIVAYQVVEEVNYQKPAAAVQKMISFKERRTELMNLPVTLGELQKLDALISHFNQESQSVAYISINYINRESSDIQLEKAYFLQALHSQRAVLVNYLNDLGIDYDA